MDVMSCVLWFIAAVCIFAYYPKPKELSEQRDGIMVEAENEDTPIPQTESNDSENVTLTENDRHMKEVELA
jgi:hypothetical protein